MRPGTWMPRLKDPFQFLPDGGVTPANAWLLNLMVFGVLMEADLGRRKIGWFRLLRSLIATYPALPPATP